VTHRRKRFFANQTGQALIEFAIASWLMFLIIFGIAGFGIAVWRYNLASNLAQEGARWAAVHGSGSTSPADNAALQAFVASRALGMTVVATATPVPSSVTKGATISVNVSTTFRPFTALFPSANLTLQSTAKMIMAR
jgi:Flp pilus assembly protein TadG